MGKIFKTSGQGAYAFVIGLCSGYPIGAKTVCELKNEGYLEKNEAQRLLGFCNNSGPLFILGTVGSAMLLNEKIGFLLLLLHFLSAFLTGLMLRAFSKNAFSYNIKKSSFKKALKEIIIFRQKNKKPIGEIMAISVKASMETLLQIGGFIILFSVLGGILSPLFDFFSLNPALKGFFMGILEITNGCSLLANNPDPFKISLIIGLISWGGFSIHAQSLAIIAKTDLNPLYYILCKAFQGLIAFLLSLSLTPAITKIMLAKQSFNPQNTSALDTLKASSLSFLWAILGLIGIALISGAFGKILNKKNNYILKYKK